MKKVFKAVLCFLPFIIFVAFVNWQTDPANILRIGYEEAVADILLEEQNASNLSNLDDRVMLEYFIENDNRSYSTLVLGSSHSMQIGAFATGDEDTFCAGVTGGDLRDMISLYTLFEEKSTVPQNIVLVLDGFHLNENYGSSRTMLDGYTAFCEANGFNPITPTTSTNIEVIATASQVLSLPYFQESIKQIRQNGFNVKSEPLPTVETYTPTAMRRFDGTWSYSEDYRLIDENTKYENRVQDVFKIPPEYVRNFAEVSEDLTKQYTAFIQKLQKDGVNVTLVLSPFHPLYYDHMLANPETYALFLSTEEVFNNMADYCGITLYGSYNPHTYSLTELDFYDAQHCTDEAIQSFLPLEFIKYMQ